ncbi:MAG: hypothetical protein A3G93_01430 [Nitrospinae bacterium RIFCSPLOWO2_12_FULL_45_22]|nr:MAG: hypothetical protein A3G93_01430 [Nitrospinae bacterium RIFCSPLOWO2_12_FULL_45_22]
MKELKLEIGGITIRVASAKNLYLKVDPAHELFLVQDTQCDFILQVNSPPAPNWQSKEVIYLSKGLWSLYRIEGKFLIILCSPAPGSFPYQAVIFDEGLKDGELYIQPTNNYSVFDLPPPTLTTTPILINPFTYPLEELLMVMLLSRRSGLIIHACGINYNGRGILFAGTSGAGKSTLANICGGKDMSLLSDDRIIVRSIGDRFWMYGTPWHGDARACSPERVPLEKIYLLRHDYENQIVPLPIMDAASRLLVCSFPPFYEKRGMEDTLDLLERLVKHVAVFELRFVPDDSVLASIKDHLKNE